ncbi:MAG: hypothetical protein ABW203_03950 [Novosphingobium sp.]
MSTMLVEVYDAFKDAGASDEKARAAASAIADYDNRLAKLEADVSLLKWMVGFNIALSVAMLGILLRFVAA